MCSFENILKDNHIEIPDNDNEREDSECDTFRETHRIDYIKQNEKHKNPIPITEHMNEDDSHAYSFNLTTITNDNHKSHENNNIDSHTSQEKQCHQDKIDLKTSLFSNKKLLNLEFELGMNMNSTFGNIHPKDHADSCNISRNHSIVMQDNIDLYNNNESSNKPILKNYHHASTTVPNNITEQILGDDVPKTARDSNHHVMFAAQTHFNYHVSNNNIKFNQRINIQEDHDNTINQSHMEIQTCQLKICEMLDENEELEEKNKELEYKINENNEKLKKKEFEIQQKEKLIQDYEKLKIEFEKTVNELQTTVKDLKSKRNNKRFSIKSNKSLIQVINSSFQKITRMDHNTSLEIVNQINTTENLTFLQKKSSSYDINKLGLGISELAEIDATSHSSLFRRKLCTATIKSQIQTTNEGSLSQTYEKTQDKLTQRSLDKRVNGVGHNIILSELSELRNNVEEVFLKNNEDKKIPQELKNIFDSFEKKIISYTSGLAAGYSLSNLGTTKTLPLDSIIEEKVYSERKINRHNKNFPNESMEYILGPQISADRDNTQNGSIYSNRKKSNFLTSPFKKNPVTIVKKEEMKKLMKIDLNFKNGENLLKPSHNRNSLREGSEENPTSRDNSKELSNFKKTTERSNKSLIDFEAKAQSLFGKYKHIQKSVDTSFSQHNLMMFKNKFKSPRIQTLRNEKTEMNRERLNTADSDSICVFHTVEC